MFLSDSLLLKLLLGTIPYLVSESSALVWAKGYSSLVEVSSLKRFYLMFKLVVLNIQFFMSNLLRRLLRSYFVKTQQGCINFNLTLG